jgi:hypothetical protein
MFGVNGPLGIWVQRVTYLIDQNRTIQGRVKAHFSIAEHEEFIRKAIELQKMGTDLFLGKVDSSQK